MLDVLAGAEPSTPYLPYVPGTSFADEVGKEPGRLRIGVYVPTTINPTPSAAARAAVATATKLLDSLGHEIVELSSAPYDDEVLTRDFLTTWFASVAGQVASIKASTGCANAAFEQDTLVMAGLGRGTSAVDYIAALERRHDHVRRLAAFHQAYDLLLTPTLATPAAPAALDRRRPAAGRTTGGCPGWRADPAPVGIPAGAGRPLGRPATPARLDLAGRSDTGTWRSLVAHLTGGQGVAGSNPVVPTVLWQ